MKGAWTQFRMYLAEKLLSWAFDLVPSSEKDGRRLRVMIIEYLEGTTVIGNTRKYKEIKRRNECGYCGGSGMHPFKNGECPICVRYKENY